MGGGDIRLADMNARSKWDRRFPNQMHAEKVTVRCGFWSDGVQNDTGHRHNRQRRALRISDFSWPKLDDMDTDDTWFRHGTALHATTDICARTRCKIDRPYRKHPLHTYVLYTSYIYIYTRACNERVRTKSNNARFQVQYIYTHSDSYS